MHRLPPVSLVSFASVALLASLGAACAKGERGNAAAGDSAGGAAAATTPAPAGATNADADLADLSRYKLSMDKVDRYYAAQRNIFAKVKDMSPAEREALKESQGTNANASLDDMVRNVENQPVMRAALREAGLSPREYTMITMSLFQSMMAVSVLDMRPKDNQDSLAREMKVNPDNVKFVREHQAELTQKQNELQAELKRMGVPQG